MNNIRQVQALNKRELENAIPPEASWHADYRDTAYIYIGGLPFDLSEGDIVTIFSQFGEPVHVNLVRDKETGKSRGFAFLKYEDQRSTDLAVDNLGGATVLGRMLRVDHTRYKKRDDEEDTNNVAKLMGGAVGKEVDGDTDDEGRESKRRDRGENRNREPRSRQPLKEEIELQELIRNHDDEDPMKEFLIEEKREEVAQALERQGKKEKSSRRRDSSKERSSRHSRHHHRRHHHRRHRHNEDRSRSKERDSQDYRERSRKDRSYRDRSPERSRSPESRRERDRRDRHR
ncbi:hypothetical protein BJX70DRAFT_170619 [Aspergillus crustosus]